MRLAAVILAVVLSTTGCARAPEVTVGGTASAPPASGSTLATATATISPATALPSASPSPTDAVREVPTVEDARIVARLVAFARARDAGAFAAVPLADTIGLELDDQIPLERRAASLARPEGWVLDVDEFRGYKGPFSALDLLARDVPTTISIGPHPDCASPMNPTPAALAELRRISVQPKDVDTCVQWWAVDIYVSLAGRITVVALDLWAP